MFEGVQEQMDVEIDSYNAVYPPLEFEISDDQLLLFNCDDDEGLISRYLFPIYYTNLNGCDKLMIDVEYFSCDEQYTEQLELMLRQPAGIALKNDILQHRQLFPDCVYDLVKKTIRDVDTVNSNYYFNY